MNRAFDDADGRSSSDPTLLRCEHLSVRRGAREVLTDISLELRVGELVALLGPNGAGKSTLLDAIAGSLPVAGGRIERHGRIAVALQSGDLARRTALANVTAALQWWGVPRRERAALAAAALSLLGAEHLADRQADSLSGGERRRVHLARAIAVRPDILLFDEPFAGVDVETRSALLEDRIVGDSSVGEGDAGRSPRSQRGLGDGRPPADPARRTSGRVGRA